MTAASSGVRDDCSDLSFSLWCVAGKGDWKYRKEWLQERRSYANAAGNSMGGEICRRCSAGQTAHWAEAIFCHEWYRDERSGASGIGPIAPLGFPDGFVCEVRLWQLPGWCPEMEWSDLLHVLWAGVGRDLTGTLLMDCAETLDHGPGTTWNQRLHHLHGFSQVWCSKHGIRPSTLEEFRRLDPISPIMPHM